MFSLTNSCFSLLLPAGTCFRPCSCAAAIATLNDQTIDNRPVIVREDREESKFRNSVVVAVSGLPTGTSWQAVKDFFRDAGEVSDEEGGGRGGKTWI